MMSAEPKPGDKPSRARLVMVLAELIKRARRRRWAEYRAGRVGDEPRACEDSSEPVVPK